MNEPIEEHAVSREEAKHVVHAAIFGLCMKDKNTCAADYSYHSLQALDALPDLGEHAAKLERDAIVAHIQSMCDKVRGREKPSHWPKGAWEARQQGIIAHFGYLLADLNHSRHLKP